MNLLNVLHPDHPLVQIDNAVVYFDTGCPRSFLLEGHGRWLDALGANLGRLPHPVSAAPPALSTSLQQITGHRVHALLGMDVIARTGLHLDRPRGQLGYGVTELPASSIELHAEQVHTLPVVHVTVEGEGRRVVLDSGCHLDGYFLTLPPGRQTGRDLVDISSLTGSFTCKGHDIGLSVRGLDGQIHTLGRAHVGENPPPLQQLQHMPGLDGVVGAAFFSRGAVTWTAHHQGALRVGLEPKAER